MAFDSTDQVLAWLLYSSPACMLGILLLVPFLRFTLKISWRNVLVLSAVWVIACLLIMGIPIPDLFPNHQTVFFASPFIAAFVLYIVCIYIISKVFKRNS